MSSVDSALLRVITSTKRKKRSHSLLSVSADIKKLVSHYGDIKDVSDIVGISPGMLNQFLKVDKLSPKMLKLVESRDIDSVSIVNSISILNFDEQDKISDYIIEGKLNSLDIRFLLPLIKKNPRQELDSLIARLKASENIKVSVIKFPFDFSLLNSRQIRDRIESLVGSDNFVSVDIDEKGGVVKILSAGEVILREKAKEQKKTFGEFIEMLLS